MRDIETREDIVLLVDTFYGEIMKDTLLSPFFNSLHLPTHLPKMVIFWSFVLLDETGYTTNVTEKHLNMKLNKTHFDRWISLFNQTLDELFAGEKVEFAKQRAFLIGWTIENKINHKN